MTRTSAAMGSALFFVAAPCVLAGVIPWWLTRWEIRPPFFGLEAFRAIGVVLVLAGLPALTDSFARFVLDGLGTPAPVAPTRKLVLTGLYRYVRNPMYAALLAIIFGQALLFGDRRLAVLGALAWAASHIFVTGFEEPGLARKYGAQYAAYRANVPRWIPRLTPWRPA
ncbi:MAG: isoprenylcysteine carboxylmethyltransferase family protein [Rhodomicrobium sp.]